MDQRYNLTGKQFGRLCVIKFHHKDEKSRSYFWTCKCICEKIVVISGISLRRNIRPTVSCGCYRYDRVSGQSAPNQLLQGRANFNSLLHMYKKAAKERDIDFILLDDEFKNLTNQNCYYCGCKPRQIHYKRETNGGYTYNGIDRLDSNKSYILNNCVSCCKTCNYAKRLMTVKEFKLWITQVYENFVKGQ